MFGTNSNQVQDSIEGFAHKIAAGKRAQVTKDFMIFGRIESLILGKGQADALERARAYIDAGADGIMIHSIEGTESEIVAFCDEYKKFEQRVPLVAVPTTYDRAHDDDLAAHGVNVIVYANQLLRSAYPAMLRTAESILRNGRAFESKEDLLPVDDFISLIPGAH